MKYDFRKSDNFSDEIDHKMRAIRYQLCENKLYGPELPGDLKNLLNKLIDSFNSRALALDAFSQYLQHLIYFFNHAAEDIDKTFAQERISTIINFPYFHCPTQEPGKFTIWIDPKTGNTALLSLCANGDIRNLISLLSIVEELCHGKNTPGYREYISYTSEQKKYSALQVSARDGHHVVVTYLLDIASLAFGGKKNEEFRKFISTVDSDGFTPFYTACKKGNLKTIRALLEAGKEAYGEDTDEYRHFISPINNADYSTINAICQLEDNEDNAEILELLLESATIAFKDNRVAFGEFISHKDPHDFTPLNSACKRGNTKQVWLLLKIAAKVYGDNYYELCTDGFRQFISEANKSGYTPLNSAVRAKDKEIVSLLLDVACHAYHDKTTQGFKYFISRPNNDGFSPFMSAAYNGDYEIAALLLENACEAFEFDKEGFEKFINQTNENEFTALNNAASLGNTKMVKILLDAASKAYGGTRTEGFRKFISKANNDGYPPLSSAAINGHEETAEILIEAAAEAWNGKNTDGFRRFISQKNEFKISPLLLACKQNKFKIPEEKREKVVKLLLNEAEIAYGGVDNSGFREFISSGDNHDCTPLHGASRENYTSLVALLLNAGCIHANAQRKDQEGFTPLSSASKLGHLEIVKLHIETAKRVLDQNEFRRYINYCNGNRSALSNACLYGHKKVAIYLVEQGAGLKKLSQINNPVIQKYLVDWELKKIRPIKTAPHHPEKRQNVEASSPNKGIKRGREESHFARNRLFPSKKMTGQTVENANNVRRLVANTGR